MTALYQSRRLARVLVDFGVDGAFSAAAAEVKEHYCVAVAPQCVLRDCLRTALYVPPPSPVGASGAFSL